MGHYIERKAKYDGTVKEYECELLEYTPGRVALFYELPENRTVDTVFLPKGAFTVAYYWPDRPYNVYHWVTPDGQTLAVYFNLATDTIVLPNSLQWKDLILDVITYPDGTSHILDENELPVPLEHFEEGRVKKVLDKLLLSMERTVQEVCDLTEKMLKQRKV